ncbi:MAG TPA: hypothetical protein VMH04_18015 [Candidatus Solibacter sp.]|nr:hypothetical protein [Candidatus Solibacter sp.]
MQSQNLIKAFFLGWLGFFFGGFVQAQDTLKFPDFSATQVFQSRKGDMAMKVYRSGSNVRVERTAAMSTLYVPASSKVYNFTTYPDQSRQCVSMSPDQAKMLPSPLQLIQGRIVKRTPAGSEIVEGRSTKIETIAVVQPNGKTIESKIWQADDLHGIPVKIESYVGKVTLRAVYRDVVIGAPELALFAIPDRCTPFEKMGEVAEMRTLDSTRK